MIGEFHPPHKEGSYRSGLARRADPITHRIDGQAGTGVKVGRRLVVGLGHQPTHVAIVCLYTQKKKKGNKIHIIMHDVQDSFVRLSLASRPASILP